LGDLRNLAIDHASGDLIVGWDDDDWHHPLRLETQVRAYRPGSTVLLQRQIRYNLLRHSGFTLSMQSGIIGTVLFGRDGGHRYPKLNRGEDTALVMQFDRRIVIDNDSLLYVRFYHAMNVWDERHIMGRLAEVDHQWEFTAREIAHLREVIPHYESLQLHP
jgi:glycosyltransferase involved in cell wall biosynthesis